MRALLALAEAEGHPLFPLLYVLTYTGMRKGEAWGLKWRSVDLDNELINVSEAVVRTHRHGMVWDRPKTDKGIRSIDLPTWQLNFSAGIEQPKKRTPGLTTWCFLDPMAA